MIELRLICIRDHCSNLPIFRALDHDEPIPAIGDMIDVRDQVYVVCGRALSYSHDLQRIECVRVTAREVTRDRGNATASYQDYDDHGEQIQVAVSDISVLTYDPKVHRSDGVTVWARDAIVRCPDGREMSGDEFLRHIEG